MAHSVDNEDPVALIPSVSERMYLNIPVNDNVFIIPASYGFNSAFAHLILKKCSPWSF